MKNTITYARYHITSRCNSKCVYCDVWKNSSTWNELPLLKARQLIDQLKAAGIEYIDFTGGEPTLYPHLGELIEYAKFLGIRTEVTSNCIPSGSSETLLRAAQSADKFNVSLDTLDSARYRKIRGVDRCEEVRKVIEDLSQRRDVKIITVVTKENLDELNSLIGYAQAHHMQIYISPAFSYGEITGNCEEKECLNAIRAKTYEPYTTVMLHFLAFISSNTQNRIPPCSANRRTLTLAPDGSLILPCYHERRTSVPWDGNLNQALASEEYLSHACMAGKWDFCKGCTVIPYMGFSFSYHLDKMFLLQSYSERLNRLKRIYINALSGLIRPDTVRLLKLLNRLTVILDSIKETAIDASCSSFYHTLGDSLPYDPDIYRAPVSKKAYGADCEKPDCWHLDCVPHVLYDMAEQHIFSVLKKLYTSGQLSEQNYVSILSLAEEFQIRLWMLYVCMYMKTEVLCDMGEEYRWIQNYLELIRKKSRDCIWEKTGIDHTIWFLLSILCPEGDDIGAEADGLNAFTQREQQIMTRHWDMKKYLRGL